MGATSRTTAPRPARHRAAAVLVPLSLLLLVTACGSSPPTPTGTYSSDVRAVSAGTLAADAPPSPEPVLTVRGPSVPNAAHELRLGLAQLEQLPTVEVAVHEPFVKRDVVFRGVRLEDLLAYAHAPTGQAVHAVALNDYDVVLPAAVTASEGAVLATRADGQPISIADGGPTRIVFSDAHPSSRDESLWIWSLATLELS